MRRRMVWIVGLVLLAVSGVGQAAEAPVATIGPSGDTVDLSRRLGDQIEQRRHHGERVLEGRHRALEGLLEIGALCDRATVLREGSGRDFLGERLEVVLARDEVRLRVDLDQHGLLAVGRALDDDHAFGGHAASLLVGLGEARLAHRLGGGLEVAVGFDERLLALHHAGARALAQLFHHLERTALTGRRATQTLCADGRLATQLEFESNANEQFEA